jgi:hypothetical protein
MLLATDQIKLLEEVISAIETHGALSNELAKKLYTVTTLKTGAALQNTISEHVVPNLSDEELFNLTKILLQVHQEMNPGTFMLRVSGILGGDLYKKFAERIKYSPADAEQSNLMLPLNKLIYENLKGHSDQNATINEIFFKLQGNLEGSKNGGGDFLMEALTKPDPENLQFAAHKLSMSKRMALARIGLTAPAEMKKKQAPDFVSIVEAKIGTVESEIKKKNYAPGSSADRVGESILASARNIITEKKKNKVLIDKDLQSLQQNLNKIEIILNSRKTAEDRLGALDSLAAPTNLDIGERQFAQARADFVIAAVLQELEISGTKNSNPETQEILQNIRKASEKLIVQFNHDPIQLNELARVLVVACRTAIAPTKEQVSFLKAEVNKHQRTGWETLCGCLLYLVNKVYKPTYSITQRATFFKQPNLGQHLSALVESVPLKEDQNPKRTVGKGK